MTLLLSNFGFRTTLRIWALTVVVFSLPLLSYARPRLPSSTSHPRSHATSLRQLFDLSFLLTPYFLILQACNVIESTGYFLPYVYLPLYAENALQSSTIACSFTVAAKNCASCIGTICMGSLIDRFHVTTCILVSALGST